MVASYSNSSSAVLSVDDSLTLQAVSQSRRPPVFVEARDPATRHVCHFATWLFDFSDDEMEFNADRINFEAGMRVTVVSKNNHRIEGFVKAVQQYSLSSQKVRVQVDQNKNHRPPVTQIFSK